MAGVRHLYDLRLAGVRTEKRSADDGNRDKAALESKRHLIYFARLNADLWFPKDINDNKVTQITQRKFADEVR